MHNSSLGPFHPGILEETLAVIIPDQGSGANRLTGGLGLDPKLETRLVNRKPHQHVFRAEPPDVSRTSGAEDVEKVDDPITSPRTFAFRRVIHLLDSRLRRQRGTLG